jgi:hypothetical protein
VENVHPKVPILIQDVWYHNLIIDPC